MIFDGWVMWFLFFCDKEEKVILQEVQVLGKCEGFKRFCDGLFHCFFIMVFQCQGGRPRAHKTFHGFVAGMEQHGTGYRLLVKQLEIITVEDPFNFTVFRKSKGARVFQPVEVAAKNQLL